MKKLLTLCFLVFTGMELFAQNGVGAWKLDVSAGYAKPTEGFGVKPGVTFVLEPHVFAAPNLAVGLRLEGAFLGYQAQSDEELFSFFGSTCVTGDYYFSHRGVKPFMGMGFGLYTRHDVYLDTEYDNDDLVYSEYGAVKLGFLGRAGIEFGHLKLMAAYNVIGANFSYAGFTIGYTVGGL